jgi:hypothetical protein
MSETALKLTAQELQNVALDESGIARAVALAQQTNAMVRKAADIRLAFEDEPATYLHFLNDEAEPQ